MAGFTIDLAGRVRNFDLPKNQPLIPLYEAIVNSIYAIQERQQKEEFDGKIEVEIIRDPQQVAEIEGIDKSINEITGFRIIDNGVGLDDNNMKSFLQSDSTYRADKGGKGVGRFSWLKAFSKTHIESVYKDENDGVWVKREFEFSLDKLDIDDRLVEEKGAFENRTCVSLIDYLPTYRKHVNKNAETIAMKIMQHCMIYLMSPKCPQICVIDEERYSINSMFEKKIYRERESANIDVNGEKFEILHTQVHDISVGGSKLFLFANDRMVKDIDLNKEIVDLDKNIFEDKGYYYVGILSGKFLDDNVDMNRTSFDISENKEDEEVSMEDIVLAAKSEVEKYLSEYLDEVHKNKDEHIRKYIHNNAPQFRHLLKYMPESINKIKPGLTDNKLDEELYKIKRKFDTELKKANKEILEKIDVGTENLAEYKDKFETQFQKISEANMAALAEYVAHRKVVLELLKKGINIKEDGKFNKEAYIHNLIYPMRRTSDEIEYSSHNLWLIDERLSYSEYISSDIPFDNNPKEERTDVMILDSPVAVSDEDNSGKEYETIVILELKRPMRDRFYFGKDIIIGRDIYPIYLDLSDFVERYGGIVAASKELIIYTEELIQKRLNSLANGLKMNDVFKGNKNEILLRISREAMGVPRTIGLILQNALTQAEVRNEKFIQISDINVGVRETRKIYFKQFQGAVQKKVIPGFYMDMWNSLLKRALDEKAKNSNRPASHFMIDPIRKKYLNIFCENFMVHCLEDSRASKYGGNYVLYAIDYDICNDNSIIYADQKDEFTAIRFIYDSVFQAYDCYFLKDRIKSYKCPICNRIYDEMEVAQAKVKRCFECDEKLEEIIHKDVPISDGNYTEVEVKILGIIATLSKEEAMSAAEIGDAVGCSYQKVANWCSKVLAKKELINIEKREGRNYYYDKMV